MPLVQDLAIGCRNELVGEEVGLDGDPAVAVLEGPAERPFRAGGHPLLVDEGSCCALHDIDGVLGLYELVLGVALLVGLALVHRPAALVGVQVARLYDVHIVLVDQLL